MMKHIMTLFLTAIISAAMADNLVSINSPIVNQMLIPNEQVTLQHTVNGIKKNSINTRTALVPNYPSLIDVYFRWTSKKSSDRQSISLTAASGLATTPIAGGARDKTYTYHWKLPHCQFFKRYSPSDWSFSLIFQPQYPEITASRAAGSNSTKMHAIEILGPEQAVITIPISINLNSTSSYKHEDC